MVILLFIFIKCGFYNCIASGALVLRGCTAVIAVIASYIKV